MKCIRPMILLVREAPHSLLLARSAEVQVLLGRALRHLAPMTIADPAKLATEVANHYLDIRAL